jgi:SH3-like domain-containing protein
MAAGALTLLAGIGLGAEAFGQLSAQPAVVVATEAVARYGPLDESQSAFVLRDGAELIILDKKDGWLQVGDAHGRSGWVKQEQLATVKSNG